MNGIHRYVRPAPVYKWHFAIEYCDGKWSWFERIKDEYLNGFFIGYWFIGWIR